MLILAEILLGMGLVALLVYWRARKLSFAAQSPADYAGKGPTFDLRRHLQGPLICEGMVFGPTGRVTSRFVADMDGVWDGDRGTLRERFRYDNGRIQTREWRLTALPGGEIKAEADDVPGHGTGRAEGSAVMLRYRIRLDPEAGGHTLDVTDWMYLLDNGTILNRSQFRKFGIMVAELQAVIRPRPEAGRQSLGQAA
jgi:hypothetical protein